MSNNVCWTALILSDMNLSTQRPSCFLLTHKLSFLLELQCLKPRNNYTERNSMLLPSRLLFTLFSHCLLELHLLFQSLAFPSLEDVPHHCNTQTYSLPPVCSTARALQTFVCIQTTWGSCYETNSDSVVLGWGLRFCIFTTQGCNSCPGTTLSRAKLWSTPLLKRVDYRLAHLARLWVPGGQWLLLIYLYTLHNILL